MPSEWLKRRVIGFAHQGGALEAPASTIFAMCNAERAGVGGLEVDVHRSLDGELIVLHDKRTDASTQRRARIAELTWNELSQLDNAYWFTKESKSSDPDLNEVQNYNYRGLAPMDSRFGIARLGDVLGNFSNMVINIDIKDSNYSQEPYEDLVIGEILRFNAVDRVIVASFNDSSLNEVRKQYPDISTSAGPGEIAEFYFTLLASPKEAVDIAAESPYVAFQIPRYYGEIELVTLQFVEAAHSAGKAVHVWTIDDEKQMEDLLRLGVDGIMSDRPSLLARSLKKHSVLYRL